MTNFDVQDMTCGHCVKAVTQAVKTVDPKAYVSVDLASKRVQIDSSAADELALKTAIAGAGYTPVAVTADARRQP